MTLTMMTIRQVAWEFFCPTQKAPFVEPKQPTHRDAEPLRGRAVDETRETERPAGTKVLLSLHLLAHALLLRLKLL